MVYSVQPQQPLVPGSKIKVWSKRNNVFHVGIVDWPDWSGARVIHNPKGGFVQTTSLTEFTEGGIVQILWAPQTTQQQAAVIQRMHSLDGKRYDLFEFNCEHAVNLALTGRSYSEQLGFAALLGLGLICVVGLAAAHSA